MSWKKEDATTIQELYTFRELTDEEEKDFRQAGKEAFEKGEPFKDIYHPVYRNEYIKSKLLYESLGQSLSKKPSYQ